MIKNCINCGIPICHFQRTSTKGFVDAQNVIPNPDIEELMMSWILEKYYIEM